MERKKFLKKIAVGGSILFTAPVILNACSDDDDDTMNNIVVDLNSLNLDNIGDFDYSGDIIIARTGTNSYIAMSKICTHQGCTVEYDHDDGNLPCDCHGSVYNLSGGVIAGPAPASLKTYTVRLDGDNLILS